MKHSTEEHTNLPVSRRDALKALAAVGGATALTTLPTQWEKPIVQVGALPAFAQASPGQYPFTNEVESIEFEGNDGPLQTAVQPGWIIVAPENSTVGAAGYDYPWVISLPWLTIVRKFEIVIPPPVWGTLTIKIKIKFKFHPKPGFGSSNVPANGTDIWLFGISGANLGLFQYYVIKAKITDKKVEFVYQVPAISSGFWPFYFSAFFPFTIVLVNGSSLFPGFYLGPGCFGDQVSTSFLEDGADDNSGNHTATLANGYRIIFLGAFNNGDGTTSTWRYWVEELPGSQDLSNWVLELPLSCTNVVTASPEPWEVVNPDPNAGITGIKWQTGAGFSQGEFTVVLQGLIHVNLAIDSVDVAAKGPDVVLGIIAGPVCL